MNQRIISRLRFYLLTLPPLVSFMCLAISLSMDYSIFDLKLYIAAFFLEVVSLIMLKRNKKPFWFWLYLIGMYGSFLTFFICKVDFHSYTLLITVCILFYSAITTFMFNEPVSYIFSVFNFSLLTYQILFRSPIQLQIAVVELLYTGCLIIILLLTRHHINSLNHYKIRSMAIVQKSTLRILGKISEIKDLETDHHLKRVEIIIRELVRNMMECDSFKHYISEKYLEDISSAAYLHDIGKIGVSDSIINKEGPLSEEEFILMRQHTVIGYNLLREAQKEIEEESIYTLAMEIARYHHEKWDGSGYPDGLACDKIPLSARIMAVADVYDALVSKRSYKRAFSHDESVQIIQNGSGIHFDPQIARVFVDHADSIYRKIKEYVSSDGSVPFKTEGYLKKSSRFSFFPSGTLQTKSSAPSRNRSFHPHPQS